MSNKTLTLSQLIRLSQAVKKLNNEIDLILNEPIKNSTKETKFDFSRKEPYTLEEIDQIIYNKK